MDRERILMVGNFLSSHGFARGVCEELAPRLRAAGWSVRTTSDRLSRVARLVDMLATTWEHRKEYDVAQVDLYSGSAFRWAEAVCWLLRQIGKPYVLTLHGGGLPNFARKRKKRVTNLLSSAAAVTAPSEYLRDQMSEYRSDLVLLPNALDLSSYERRERLLLHPRIIWLRSFHEIYNPVMAVRALVRLKDRFPAIHLTMAGRDKGDGSWQATIAEAKALQLEDHLEIRGPIPKPLVPHFLNSGDIFLNTSRVDNTPVSVLEAMASGLSIVSTEVGGIPYLLESGCDSILVQPDDDAAMAAGVRRLLTEEGCAGAMRKKAYAKVSAFDWSAVLPQWLSLLKSVQGKASAQTALIGFHATKIKPRQLDDPSHS